MKELQKSKDRRLEFVDALLRYAEGSGSEKPMFYKDEMMQVLGVCEHVFNIMQKQLGDRYCCMADSFEERSRYAINVSRCYELRNRLIQEDKEEKKRLESIRYTLLATSVGTFIVVLFRNVIM
jgi:hypothetical protein